MCHQLREHRLIQIAYTSVPRAKDRMHWFPHRLSRHYLAQLEQHPEEPSMPGMWFRLHGTLNPFLYGVSWQTADEILCPRWTSRVTPTLSTTTKRFDWIYPCIPKCKPLEALNRLHHVKNIIRIRPFLATTSRPSLCNPKSPRAGAPKSPRAGASSGLS